MTTALGVLALLAVLTVSGVLARLTKVPLPILQIAIGAVLALPAAGVHLTLDPELFLLIVIPPLLFVDAFNAPKREFKALSVPILGLAFGLVFLTVTVLGYGLHWLFPALPLPVAFALAAVLSPTDAVAVSSIVDRHRVPPTLMHILEGEALLNDASGLVVFRFAVAATLTGQFSMAEALPTFALTVAGGVIAGLAVSFGASWLQWLLRSRDGDPSKAQVILTLLLPFAAYLLAEHAHASGILAAVTTGLTIARAGYLKHMTVAARLQNRALWETLSFAFNGATFLLLGLQLPAILSAVPPAIPTRLFVFNPVLAAVLVTFVLIAVRFAWIEVGVAARRSIGRMLGRPQRLESFRARIAASIAGVRGAVTLAGVLSLPLVLSDGSPFPGRDLAIFLAVGVILCSLIAASVLLPIVTRGLKMAGDDPIEAEERFARIAAAQAAAARVEALAAEAEADGRGGGRDVAARLVDGYRRRAAAHDVGTDMHREARDASDLERHMLAAALTAERETVRRLLTENRINDETLHKLMTEIALAEALLTHG